MCAWEKVRLGEVTQINPKERLAKGTLATKIAMEHLQPFCRKLQGKEISSFSSGSKFRNGDTLLARITPCLENGKTAQVDILQNNEVAFGSTEFIVLRAIEDVTDSKFIYYLMRSPFIRNLAIKSMVGSSGRQRVQYDVLSNIEFELPPLEGQKRIAAILSSLDDTIENNNAINRNLEEQAQALFKSWFVDFEPFRGVMPSDWEEGVLEDIAELKAGGDKPKNCSLVKTEDCTIPIYSNGIDNEGLYGYTDSAKIFKESVTVSARGTIGYTCLRHEPYVPIVRLISILPKSNLSTAKYLYLYLRSKKIDGVGTTQQQLTVPMFKKEHILIPNYKSMEQFTNIIEPFYSTIVALKMSSLKLAELRDTLIPKLMSGEIHV